MARALGFAPGEFQQQYAELVRAGIDRALESNAVAQALDKYLADRILPIHWQGTAGQLYDLLNTHSIPDRSSWPRSPKGLSDQLRRIAPAYRAKGIDISHNWYPGAHPAIVDHGLWGRVHEILAKDGHARSVETKIRSRTDALLRGLLYAPTGERMYPTYSRKNGRKYRYYVSKSEARFGAAGKTYERIPADEVEAAAVAQIKSVLGSPEAITAVCQFVQRNGAQVTEDVAVMAMHQLGDVWEQLYPAERHRIVNLMIQRVDIVPGGLKVKWRELGWKELIGEFAPDSIGAEMVDMEAA